MRLATSLAALLALTLFAPSSRAQTTWYVDGGNVAPGTGTEADPYASIQIALDQATTLDGDTVSVAPGAYLENVDLLGKGVRLVASGGAAQTDLAPASTTLPTLRGGRTQVPRSVVRGFTLRDNLGAAAVLSDIGEGIVVERCVVRGNLRGLENLYDMTIRNCDVVGNVEGVIHYCDGGGHNGVSVTDLRATVFWQNGADLAGTRVEDSPFLSITDCLFEADPRFYSLYDYRLQPDSPCIDAGPMGEQDPDGTRLDVGVFAFDPNWPLAESYCTPADNTSGGRGILRVSGSASLGANDLILEASGVPVNASGIFFYGLAEVYQPLGDGYVCAGGDIARLAPSPTGPLGAPIYALDLTSDQPAHLAPIQAGEDRFFQYWFRDPNGAAGGFNFTNGARVRFVP